LSTLATIVADFGDCFRIRRQWPFSATTVAIFRNRIRQQSPNSATIVASVDRA